MSLIKLSLMAVFAVVVSYSAVTPSAFANEEAKACKADADCAHGEHCKEGHCHK